MPEESESAGDSEGPWYGSKGSRMNCMAFSVKVADPSCEACSNNCTLSCQVLSCPAMHQLHVFRNGQIFLIRQGRGCSKVCPEVA